MPPFQSLEDLERFKQELFARNDRLLKEGKIRVIVSMGSCGIAAGANETHTAVLQQIESLQLQNIVVSKTGCIGQCSQEPIVQVITPDGQKTTYGHVTGETVARIFCEHILEGKIVQEIQITA